MKRIVLTFCIALGFSALTAQTTSNISTNGVPEGIQQPTSGGTKTTAPAFETTPYTQTAPITQPIAPNVQTTSPGMQTQPANNTQYPSGDNNSPNANSNGTVNTGIISPPRD